MLNVLLTGNHKNNAIPPFRRDESHCLYRTDSLGARIDRIDSSTIYEGKEYKLGEIEKEVVAIAACIILAVAALFADNISLHKVQMLKRDYDEHIAYHESAVRLMPLQFNVLADSSGVNIVPGHYYFNTRDKLNWRIK